MSGFEIAGVVLGAIPILLKVVKGYQETALAGRMFFKKRKYLEELSNSLHFQHGTLLEVARMLLLHSGCDPEDVLCLDTSPLELMKQYQVQERILQYLGRDTEVAFTTKLAQSLVAIQTIVTGIARLIPTAKGVTDDILALIVANRKDDGKHIDLIPRFKLMFGASNLTNAIDELETAVSGLNRLIHTVTRSRQPVESEPSRQTKRLAKAFRHLSSLASSLHTALGNGWSKSCHPSHNAQLFLDDRLDVLQSSKSGRHKARPAFRLVLATEAPGKESLDRLETEVHMHLDEQDLDIGRLEASSSTRVRVSFTSSHCDSDPLPTGIDDLCMALTAAQSANSANQYVAFVVSASKGRTQIATIPAPQKCLIACHQQFISLKELLSDDLTKRRIPLRSRMLLSVRLASNLLQLLNTPWLPATFSKEKIFFPATPVPKQNTPLVDFSRPFIHSEFKEDDPTAVFSQNYASPPKETLLELGILLLEIWHEQTLEERFSLDKSPVEFFDRLPLALKWAEESHTELLESYENAVCYCTGFMTGESRGSQWKDDKLWASVYGEVIEPLARNCKLWR